METYQAKNINDYCEENINFIYENLSPEYKKQYCKNIRSICSVYEYMEFEILCMRDICKSNNCINYFKKLHILPISLIEVEIEDKYFPEKKLCAILYRKIYDKLITSLINIRTYIKYYYDIYTKYMKITVENIPPNSTIEFYNSYEHGPRAFYGDKPKIIKIIKVCKKIVKIKYEGDIKNRNIPKEDLQSYLHHTCYKIY